MPPALARHVLFLALLLTLPLPYYLMQIGRVPPVFLAFVTSEIAQAALIDGGYAGRMMTQMMVPQVAVVVLIAWVVARLAARRLSATAVLGIAAVMVVGALVTPIYRAPFVRGGVPLTLIGLFQ